MTRIVVSVLSGWKLVAVLCLLQLTGCITLTFAINLRGKTQSTTIQPHLGNYSSHHATFISNPSRILINNKIKKLVPIRHYWSRSITQNHHSKSESKMDDSTKQLEPRQSQPQPSLVSQKSKLSFVVSSVLILGILSIWKRETIISFDFKSFLHQHLEYLSSLGTVGLAFYSLTLMIWEMTVGVTTPVETAAGMAFGFTKAAIANAIGKISGAILAFTLGRFVLRDFVMSKLHGNPYFQLIEQSIQKGPIRVALIWRFSPLPEFIKNFGLAILPLKMSHFAMAVLLHGIPFTLLWSYMGHEMGLLVR